MRTPLPLLTLAVLITSSAVYAETSHYDVYMKLHDRYTITFDCDQIVDSIDEPGKKIHFPHLWSLIDYADQNIIKLSDETRGEDNTRVYDLQEGKWQVSIGTTITSILLMPCILGFFTFDPYEQEYLFYAANPGSTRLTFHCEKRYQFSLPPTKVVTIDFHVYDEHCKAPSKKLHIK